MRRRAIKPDFWLDEELAELPRDARLFYIGMWNIADGWGVLEDRPRRIKAELFPYDHDVTDQTIGGWLDMLVHSGHVVRYAVDGKALIWIRNLRRHQLASMPKEERERPPVLPLPPEAGDTPANGCQGGTTEAPPRHHVGTSAGNRVIGGTGNRGEGEAPTPRDVTVKELQRRGLAASPDSVMEWGAFLGSSCKVRKGEAPTEIPRAFDLIQEAAKRDGVVVRYSRDAAPYAQMVAAALALERKQEGAA